MCGLALVFLVFSAKKLRKPLFQVQELDSVKCLSKFLIGNLNSWMNFTLVQKPSTNL